jgi:hypothetical protein
MDKAMVEIITTLQPLCPHCRLYTVAFVMGYIVSEVQIDQQRDYWVEMLQRSIQSIDLHNAQDEGGTLQ